MESAQRGGAGSAPAGLAAVAWLAMLPASSLSLILYRLAVHHDPPSWFGLAMLALLAALAGLSFASAALRPVRGYLLALAAFQGGSLLAEALAPAFGSGDWLGGMLLRALLQLISCALMALTLLGSRLERRDLFLAIGDMAAPARIPGEVRGISWRWFGPLLMVVLAAGLSVQLFLTVKPDARMLGSAQRVLPWALAFAALNAAQEEFRYRAVLLARLVPFVGRLHALLLTSTLFGLDHWFGHPSGPSGVLLAGFAGYLWGKSMIETRGAGWAWLIHAFQDVVIVVVIAAAHGG
jgi:membrane protease YdiL (CAAX protease family)